MAAPDGTARPAVDGPPPVADANAPPAADANAPPAADGPPAADAPPAADGTGSPAQAGLSEEARKALAYVLRSTEARPQTEGEIRAKLRRREVEEADAGAAIREARKLGAIDDAAFARLWVEDRGVKRKLGTRRLRTELRRRQVPEDVIDVALEILHGRDEEAAATELARERAMALPATLPPETVARRLVAFLARRGYPEGLAKRVAISVSGLDRRWD